jgi:hypothetical protein
MTEIAFWIAHILVAVCGLTRYGWRHAFLSLTPRSSFASMSSDPLTGAVRPNRLASTVARLQPLPSGLRTWVVSLLLGRAVPLVGTAGLRFEQITSDRVVVRVANRRKVQNHIGGVHAAGMVLLAETATGFCVGMNVPRGCRWSAACRRRRWSWRRPGSTGLHRLAHLLATGRQAHAGLGHGDAGHGDGAHELERVERGVSASGVPGTRTSSLMGTDSG